MTTNSTGLSFQIRFAQQSSDLIGFENMTYPLFVQLFQRVSTDADLLAVVAHSGQEPVGLALAEIQSGGTSAVVRSVYVEPDHRRKGGALAMLGLIEARLRERAVPRITGSYAMNPAVDALLVQAGWVEPQPSMVLFHANKAGMEALEHAPFFRDTMLGPGQEIVPWNQLTPADHAGIEEAIVRYDVARGLTPATEPELLDPELSLALRVEGTVYVKSFPDWKVSVTLVPGKKGTRRRLLKPAMGTLARHPQVASASGSDFIWASRLRTDSNTSRSAIPFTGQSGRP